MCHDVIEVKCLDDFQLALTFDDGKSGILDCKPILARGGVFSRLRDPAVIRAVGRQHVRQRMHASFFPPTFLCGLNSHTYAAERAR